MVYIYTLIVTVMFSFVATLGTLAKQWVSAEVVAFSRFFFGAVFIVLYMLISRKKFHLRYNSYWIWFGVLFKVLNYLAENTALSEGYTFGQIIGWPVQAVAILFSRSSCSVRRSPHGRSSAPYCAPPGCSSSAGTADLQQICSPTGGRCFSIVCSS